MSYVSVEDAIRDKFDVVATAQSLAVIHDNAPPATLTQTWSRFAVIHEGTEQIHCGPAGSRRYRSMGRVIATLYSPVAKGDAALAAIVDAIMTAFTGSTIASPLVEFTPPPSPTTPPERDETWWRREVTIPFQFDFYA